MTKRKKLFRKLMWKVQLEQYPDSVQLEDSQVLGLIPVSVPDWLRDKTLDQWRKDECPFTYDNDLEAEHAFYAWRDKEIMYARFIWALNAFSDRSASKRGFFYACGKQENGWYKHIGFRMGLSPSDYLSGYMGLNYKEEIKE